VCVAGSTSTARHPTVYTVWCVWVTQLMRGASIRLLARSREGVLLLCCVAVKALQVGSCIFRPGQEGHTSPDVMLSGWFSLFVYNSLPLCQRIRAGRCAVCWSTSRHAQGCVGGLIRATYLGPSAEKARCVCMWACCCGVVG
jgi:hypothetical protein